MAGIEIKSKREIGLMRDAGLIVSEAHDLVRRIIEPGMTTLALDRAIDEHIRRHGGRPTFLGQYGFPKNVCISVNDEVVHGIPGSRKLREGDLVSIDIGCTKRGFIGDSAWTHTVGRISKAAARLMELGEESLMTGLRLVRTGADLRDISRTIQEFVEQAGYSVVRDYTGHGVGRVLHESPQVPNYVVRGARPLILRSGMTLAIEPMVNQGKAKTRKMRDGWTVATHDKKPSVHFEHTVAVTPDGPLILTAREGESRRLMGDGVRVGGNGTVKEGA